MPESGRDNGSARQGEMAEVTDREKRPAPAASRSICREPGPSWRSNGCCRTCSGDAAKTKKRVIELSKQMYVMTPFLRRCWCWKTKRCTSNTKEVDPAPKRTTGRCIRVPGEDSGRLRAAAGNAGQRCGAGRKAKADAGAGAGDDPNAGPGEMGQFMDVMRLGPQLFLARVGGIGKPHRVGAFEQPISVFRSATAASVCHSSLWWLSGESPGSARRYGFGRSGIPASGLSRTRWSISTPLVKHGQTNKSSRSGSASSMAGRTSETCCHADA